MALSAILLAASLTAAAQGELFKPDDYPDWAVRRDLSAGVEATIVLDPKGRVVQMDTTRAIGDQKLAQEIASLVAKSHAAPARWSDGSPAYARFHAITRAFLPDTPQGNEVRAAVAEPDLALMVQGLPSGVGVAQAKLLLAVNADGSIADCQPSPSETAKALARSLCATPATLVQPVVRGGDGQPVRYVAEVKVQLQAERPVTPN